MIISLQRKKIAVFLFFIQKLEIITLRNLEIAFSFRFLQFSEALVGETRVKKRVFLLFQPQILVKKPGVPVIRPIFGRKNHGFLQLDAQKAVFFGELRGISRNLNKILRKSNLKEKPAKSSICGFLQGLCGTCCVSPGFY